MCYMLLYYCSYCLDRNAPIDPPVVIPAHSECVQAVL